MISLVKIMTEGYAFDADDYVPYANLKVDDIVRCNETGDELRVLEVLGDNKLIVSLMDDPRDIRAVIFDEDVTAHASDQNRDDRLDEIERDYESDEDFTEEDAYPYDCDTILFNVNNGEFTSFNEYEVNPEDELIFNLGDGTIYECHVTVDKFDKSDDRTNSGKTYYEPLSLEFVDCDHVWEIVDGQIERSEEVAEMPRQQIDSMMKTIQLDIDSIVD